MQLGLDEMIRLSLSDMFCHYSSCVCAGVDLCCNCWASTVLKACTININFWFSYCRLYYAAVVPSIPLSPGPRRLLLSRETCVLWIAESPFAGGCPYLLRCTTFGQLVAKEGTLGRSAAACCVFTAIGWIAPTLANFPKASHRLVCKVRPVVFWHVQVRWADSWGPTEGMLGPKCDDASLSASADGGLPWPRDTVPLSDTAALPRRPKKQTTKPRSRVKSRF